MAESITLQVFWQDADGVATLCAVRVPAGSTLGDAVRASRVHALLPTGWERGALQLAVWGQPRPLQDVAAEGDRIDLLRPLRIDPKEARRRRARHRASPPGVSGASEDRRR